MQNNRQLFIALISISCATYSMNDQDKDKKKNAEPQTVGAIAATRIMSSPPITRENLTAIAVDQLAALDILQASKATTEELEIARNQAELQRKIDEQKALAAQAQARTHLLTPIPATTPEREVSAQEAAAQGIQYLFAHQTATPAPIDQHFRTDFCKNFNAFMTAFNAGKIRFKSCEKPTEE